MKTPERWYLNLKNLTSEEDKIISDYFYKQSGNNCYKGGLKHCFASIKSHNMDNDSIEKGLQGKRFFHSSFANAPDASFTEITFKQFEEHILNKKKMYSIEDIKARKEKLAVFLETEEQWNTLKKIFPDRLSQNYYGNYYYDAIGYGYWSDSSPKELKEDYGYTAINYNQIQFENMENRKIIGYKLAKKEYNEAALKIVNIKYWNPDPKCDFFADSMAQGYLENAGVLDLWFEPVYGETTPNVIIKGYKAEKTEKGIKFGCQEYSKEFITTLHECLRRNDFTLTAPNEGQLNARIEKLANFLNK